ncbi:MAG: conjugal transfer protein TraG N-terminal domain-containing protein [Gammaproteobacteria bacterium]
MKSLFLFFFFVLVPGQAFALDGTIYTYGSFEPTVNALSRISLIYSDNRFTGLAMAVAALSVLIAVGVNSITNIFGSGTTPMQAVIVFLLGASMYTTMVMRTGDILVQDEVENRSRTIANIPNLIVFVTTNLSGIEKTIVDIIDTGNIGLFKYKNNPGTSALEMLIRSVGASGNYSDAYASRTLDSYIQKCLPQAIKRGVITPGELMANAVNDMPSVLAKAKSDHFFSIVYTSADPVGSSQLCSDSWDGAIAPTMVTNGVEYVQAMQSTCESLGLDPTDANFGLSCNNRMSMAGELLHYPQGITPANIWRNLYFSKKILSILQYNNADETMVELSNMSFMRESLGIGASSNEWLPVVRGVLYGSMLGIMPFALLFLATPIAGRALMYLSMTFLWFLAWTVTDVISFSFLNDYIFSIFGDYDKFSMGLQSILNLPDKVEQSVAVASRSRSGSALLATSFVFVMFKYGGNSLASMAGNIQNTMEKTGSDAGNKTLEPGTNATMAQSMVQSQGWGQAIANSGGHEAQTDASAQNFMEKALTATNMSASSMGQGSSLNQNANVARQMAQKNAGTTIGATEALNDGSPGGVQKNATASAAASTGQGLSYASAIKNSASRLGMSQQGLQNAVADYSMGKQTAEVGAVQNAAAAMDMSGQELLNNLAHMQQVENSGDLVNFGARMQFTGARDDMSKQIQASASTNRPVNYKPTPQQAQDFAKAHPEVMSQMPQNMQAAFSAGRATVNASVGADGQGASLVFSTGQASNTNNSQKDDSSVSNTSGLNANNPAGAAALLASLGDAGVVNNQLRQISMAQPNTLTDGMSGNNASLRTQVAAAGLNYAAILNAATGLDVTAGQSNNDSVSSSQSVTGSVTGGKTSSVTNPAGGKLSISKISGGYSVQGAASIKHTNTSNSEDRVSGSGYNSVIAQHAEQIMQDMATAETPEEAYQVLSSGLGGMNQAIRAEVNEAQDTQGTSARTAGMGGGEKLWDSFKTRVFDANEPPPGIGDNVPKPEPSPSFYRGHVPNELVKPSDSIPQMTPEEQQTMNDLFGGDKGKSGN